MGQWPGWGLESAALGAEEIAEKLGIGLGPGSAEVGAGTSSKEALGPGLGLESAEVGAGPASGSEKKKYATRREGNDNKRKVVVGWGQLNNT